MTTERLTEHNEATAGLWIQTTWRPNCTPNPLAWQDVGDWKRIQEAARPEREAAEQELRAAGSSLREITGGFNERFGTPRRVHAARARRQPPPAGTWPGWYDPRDVLAIALGAPEPRWMNGSWWHDREHYALSWVESPADVARIKAPTWPRLPVVERMLAKREQWQRECPNDPPSGFGLAYDLTIPGHDPAQSLNYPSFVDLGVFLMGMTRFLTALAGEPELGDALMDKCFELSTSYTEFLLSLKPERFEALCGFGGDATAMLSPKLYERYSAAWDLRLFDYARRGHDLPDDLPCNLHSCGASGHLYDLWGAHPCHRNITTVQTRLLPGHVKRLRQNLPHTQLELTIHPPQFDMATARPDEVREVLWTTAREAGFRDLHIGVIAAVHRIEDLPRVERNLWICDQAIAEIRQHSPPDA